MTLRSLKVDFMANPYSMTGGGESSLPSRTLYRVVQTHLWNNVVSKFFLPNTIKVGDGHHVFPVNALI